MGLTNFLEQENSRKLVKLSICQIKTVITMKGLRSAPSLRTLRVQKQIDNLVLPGVKPAFNFTFSL